MNESIHTNSQVRYGEQDTCGVIKFTENKTYSEMDLRKIAAGPIRRKFSVMNRADLFSAYDIIMHGDHALRKHNTDLFQGIPSKIIIDGLYRIDENNRDLRGNVSFALIDLSRGPELIAIITASRCRSYTVPDDVNTKIWDYDNLSLQLAKGIWYNRFSRVVRYASGNIWVPYGRSEDANS